MPTRIGKFEILRPLGEGAMGEVFLARDPAIGREVAIKTIRAESALGAEARERFNREARAAGTLNHPNLVTVHEFGEDGGTLYIAMEYVPGEDLQGLIRMQKLAPAESLEVLAQVCDGLAYAHARGVLHRDIKPSNVRVSRELGRLHAKVMDFGIARISGSDMTGTGTLLGTFGYMAPEYIQTGVPDRRSDLFAVGVMLYEALSGQRPFTGDTTATLLYRIVHEQAKPLDPARLRGVSPKVAAVLRRALMKDPAKRFQTAEEMAAVLRSAADPAWVGYEALEGPPTVLSQRFELKPQAPREAPKKSWIPLVAAGLLVGAGGLWAFTHRPKAPAPVPAAHGPEPRVEAPPTSPAPPPPPLEVVEARPPRPRAPEPSREPRPEPRPGPPVEPPPPPSSAQVLDAGVAKLESDPQAALVDFQKVLNAEPDNARAHALRLAALYRLERYGAMGEAMKEARMMGIHPKQMMAYPVFAKMIAEEREAHRIPPEKARHFGPPPPGEGPRRLRER